MKLEEITVERVKQAYERHNHRPDKGYKFCSTSKNDCRYYCPLQVLAADLSCGVDRISWEHVLDNSRESDGFAAGFDGITSDKYPIDHYNSKAFDLGQKFRAVLVNGLSEEEVFGAQTK